MENETVKEWRKRNCMTRRDFLRLTGLSKKQVKFYENLPIKKWPRDFWSIVNSACLVYERTHVSVHG